MSASLPLAPPTGGKYSHDSCGLKTVDGLDWSAGQRGKSSTRRDPRWATHLQQRRRWHIYLVSSAFNPFTATSTRVTLHAYQVGEPFSLFVLIQSIKTAPNSIRFYRSDEAALLNNGQLTSPHFISFYQKYGCLRFMDWQYTNANFTAQWINRPQKSHYSWIGSVSATAYCGTCARKPRVRMTTRHQTR